MITNLHIRNIGIIDDITIELNQGLNVLTGETGAGKTLIIDSLSIIAGGRFSKEMMRKGQDHSFVELGFYLPENEKAIEGTIIVSREIYANGRNLCKINGRLVTVNELRNFMRDLIDIHGQQDNQMILDANFHRSYLDSFSGETLKKEKEEYGKLYEQYKKIEEELKNNYGDEKEKQRRLDLLYYQAKEIQQANLKVGEEEELEKHKDKIQNAQKIAQNLNEVDCEIGEKAIDSISKAIRALEKIVDLDEQYQDKLNSLKSTYYDLQELSRDISILKEETEFDEEERQEVEKRLDFIFSLKRKYGNTIEEILSYGKQKEEEIKTIENLEEYRGKLYIEKEEVVQKMTSYCERMNRIKLRKRKEIRSTN